MANETPSSRKELLLLFDGNALIHRAFHALPPLSVPRTGEVVGAVFGFASMLLKVLSEYSPTYMAVAFDRAAPTFRHIVFEEYKAQRPKTPEELAGQFHRVREVVSAFAIPIYELDGFEADDVLGTLAAQASERGIEVIIVTGDADAIQLITSDVRVLTPRKGFSDTVLYDEQSAQEKFGVRPDQIADLKGLKGDPSDNIPGVPGVGEKTATKLLQQYGSVEDIYDHIDEVEPPRLRQILIDNEKIARQSKSLATIVIDVPLQLDLEDCHVKSYDRSRVAELFRDLGFKTLVSRLPGTDNGSRTDKQSARQPSLFGEEFETSPRLIPAAVQTSHQIVDTIEKLDKLIALISAAESFAFDLETTNKEPMRAEIVGIAISVDPAESFYIPVGHRPAGSPKPGTNLTLLEMEPTVELPKQLDLKTVLAKLGPYLEDASIPKAVHNGKYDAIVLEEAGQKVNNMAFDTMLAAYLMNEKNLSLNDLAFGKLGKELTPITALIGSGAKQISMAEVDIPKVTDYAGDHAAVTARLALLLKEELPEKELSSLFINVEMPLVPVLIDIERTGVSLDTAFLGEMSVQLGRQIRDLEVQVYNAVGHQFNINSPIQLGSVLFDELHLPFGRKTKTGYSTDASVLEAIKGVHPVVDLVLEYRQLNKLKSTYVDALPALINPKTGRLHTSFNQTGTSTGRLSSSDPNLQNIPIRTDLGRQVRKAFVASGGDDYTLLAADYSQIELRILAHVSQDRRLLDSFAADEDIHSATAAEVFGVPLEEVNSSMRRIAKVVNFGVVYGISDFGLAQGTELSRRDAGRFIESYFAKYPGVSAYLKATKEHARQYGYVQTLLGRRRYIPEINASNAQIRQGAERMAVNMPIQGTAADIIKIAMIEIHRELRERHLESKMILQVHDELLFEIPARELDEMKVLVRDLMQNAMTFSVPIKVDLKMGKTWGDME